MIPAFQCSTPTYTTKLTKFQMYFGEMSTSYGELSRLQNSDSQNWIQQHLQSYDRMAL